MLDLMMPGIIVGVITLVIVFVIIFSITGRHKDFIEHAQQIENGMSISEVVAIMKEEPTTREQSNGETILIWEKSQWKGIQNGGTLTRAIKVVF